MSSTARTHRRPSERRGPATEARSGRILIVVAAAVIVIAGVVALVISGNGGASATPSATASTLPASAPVITGTRLPVYAAGGTDAAAGAAIPTVSGTDFNGQTTSIAANGRPKVILFIAHWCSHCQREVPKIQAWLDASGLPKGVDIVSVVTAIDPTLPNYPPHAWLTSAHWSVPVIVDPTDTVAKAFGLSAYPFFVFVDAKGTVAARSSGELEVSAIQAAIQALGGG